MDDDFVWVYACFTKVGAMTRALLGTCAKTKTKAKPNLFRIAKV